MHHCGRHDITRPASPRARSTWHENIAMTVATQQRLKESPTQAEIFGDVGTTVSRTKIRRRMGIVKKVH